MYINTKHLQILNLIKNNPDFNLKDLSEILNLSQQHMNLYLKDIYEEISENNNPLLKNDKILKEIQNFKGAKKRLRELQEFTKSQKIFYLLFFLSKSRRINFSSISKELNITTRNLNNYKQIITNILEKYNLTLIISNQGVKLLGSNFNLKRLQYFLFFKFIIEKDYLPYKFRNDVLKDVNFDNFSKLKKDIYNFLNLLNSQHSTHQQATLLALYIAFKGTNHEKLISDIPLNQHLKYKPNHWDIEFFNKVFLFLKNSSFKIIKANVLYLIFNIIDTFNNFKPCFGSVLDNDMKSIQNIYSKYLGDNILKNPSVFPIASQWIYYCKIKQLFFIDDFSLINLNLTHIPNSNVLNLTKEVKKIIPTFTIFEGIFLWFIFSKSQLMEEINVFVFKSIEISIIPLIINEIYKKHNIKIIASINSKEIAKYLKNNIIDSIVTVENIKIYDKNVTVKNLYLPLPNYRSIKK
ncbi:hypothetical protein [Cetobacterium somerae]